MKDLVLKLPNGSPQHDAGISDDTIAAVLATLNEVIAKHSDFARALLQLGGVERLSQITQQKDTYSPRVIKFASQVCIFHFQTNCIKLDLCCFFTYAFKVLVMVLYKNFSIVMSFTQFFINASFIVFYFEL